MANHFFIPLYFEMASLRDVSHTSKLILAYLAFCERRNGESWPSVRTISEIFDMPRSNVHRDILQLQKAGYLTVISGGPRRSNRYKVTGLSEKVMSRIQGHKGDKLCPTARDKSNGVMSHRTGHTYVPPTGRSVPPHGTEVSNEVKQTLKDKKKVPKKKVSTTDPWKELSQHWPSDSDLARSDDLKEVWLAHWDCRKSKLTPYGVKLVARKFERWGLKDSIAATELSVERRYQGIDRDWLNGRRSDSGGHRPGDYRSGKVKSWDRTVNRNAVESDTAASAGRSVVK